MLHLDSKKSTVQIWDGENRTNSREGWETPGMQWTAGWEGAKPGVWLSEVKMSLWDVDRSLDSKGVEGLVLTLKTSKEDWNLFGGR